MRPFTATHRFALSPGCFMWVERSKGEKTKKNLDVESLKRQRAGFEEILAENPNNKRIERLLAQTNEDIETVMKMGPPPNKATLL